MNATPFSIGWITAEVRKAGGLTLRDARKVALAMIRDNTAREIEWLFGIKREGRR